MRFHRSALNKHLVRDDIIVVNAQVRLRSSPNAKQCVGLRWRYCHQLLTVSINSGQLERLLGMVSHHGLEARVANTTHFQSWPLGTVHNRPQSVVVSFTVVNCHLWQVPLIVVLPNIVVSAPVLVIVRGHYLTKPSRVSIWSWATASFQAIIHRQKRWVDFDRDTAITDLKHILAMSWLLRLIVHGSRGTLSLW